MRPLLSICVPTFRRAHIVYNTVLHHLSFESTDIEVVVSDNCSPDNTIELLSLIKDPRLKVHVNECNKGFHYNLSRVINEAGGYFVCLISDEDVLNHSELKKIIEWIRDFRDDNYEIGAIIPGCSANYITKKDELLGVLYGRVSYMSGIVLNSDLITAEDLALDNESYYPHVGLTLALGCRARLVFSPYNLAVQKYNDGKEAVNRVELHTNTTLPLRASPYTPQSRFNQLRSEKSMIVNLCISDRTKYELLQRQYVVKTRQATVIYDLLARSMSKLNSLGINEDHKNRWMEVAMGDTFLVIIREHLSQDYIPLARNIVNIFTKRLRYIRRSREEYDSLTLQQDYKAVIAVRCDVEKYLNDLLQYNFRVDYILSSEEKNYNHSKLLSADELIGLERVVILLDKVDAEYIDKIRDKGLNNVRYFFIQDLELST